jgi:hypothetical protein
MAFNYDAVSWRRLAEENRRNKHLSMPCCGRSVVLKTSHLKTRFFAHTRRLDSKCAVETEQHLLAKDVIARAAVATGWNAETEASVAEVNRIADVLAIRGKVKIAFEIQWSRTRDLEKRHKAYKDAGIRGLWLLKYADFWSSREVPAFRLVYAPDNRQFDVWVWDDRRLLTDKKCKPTQVVELSRFVRGALAGRLQWQPSHGREIPVEIITVSTKCLDCPGTIGLINRIHVRVDKVLPGHKEVTLPLDAFRELPEPFRSKEVSEKLLAQEGIIIRRGFSPVTVSRFTKIDMPYLDCVCARCNSPQLPYLIKGREESEERVAARFDLNLTTATLEKVPVLKDALHCWWFDER